MGVFIDAAARFPTAIFTSALVVVLGFWLLVLLGRADVRGFDADAPSLTRALGGAPVAVAASVMIVSAWLVSLAGMVLLQWAGLPGLAEAAARLTVLALSGLVAWSVTRGCSSSLARLFPDEPEPPQPDLASGTPFDPGSRRARS